MTTYALIILTVIVFPLTVMLAGTWLLSSVFDRDSALRRAVGHVSAAWATRRAVALNSL